MAKVKKTNVMRILDKHKIMYDTKTYAARLFKTLVGKGNRTGIVVFCIPSDRELDLKKAAAVSGNKHVELLHVKDLPGITGYIRGGCSPIGMKKQFPTYIDTSAENFDTISISAGQRGLQVLLPVSCICTVTGASMAGLTADHGEAECDE